MLEVVAAVLTAQRDALCGARDEGTFDADALSAALRDIDATQLTLEPRGGPTG